LTADDFKKTGFSTNFLQGDDCVDRYSIFKYIKNTLEFLPVAMYNKFSIALLIFNKEDETMLAKRMIQITLILAVLVTCMAIPRGTSAAGWCGSTYVVQRGDWLSKIASRCGVTLSALYAANPWAGSYRYIYPGQVLNIPGGPGPGHPGPGPGHPGPGPVAPYQNCGPTYSAYYGHYYVVCRGDTLLGIALYYGERLSYMQWHNHIPNPDRIYAGQFIWP
jgi:LysM repeat protein